MSSLVTNSDVRIKPVPEGEGVSGLSFSSFENLIGGSGTDIFIFSKSKSLSGVIDGGGGGDTLNYAAYTTAVTVNLATGMGGEDWVPAYADHVVKNGDELYVRSYRGRNGRWFRHAIQQRQGRIRSGGIERDVTFEEPVDADRQAIDAAYRSKYARYGATYVDAMVGESAAAATLRLVPR